MYRALLHGLFAIGLAFASNSASAAAERPEALIVAQTGTDYLLRVPVSRLQMTIPSAGLSRQAPDIGGSTDNPRYFNFTDASRGLVLSGWFESADGFTNLPDFWKREQAAWRDHGLPVAENVSMEVISAWQVIFYDVSLPGISNHHMRAHYIGAGTWIDLHVSITGSGPDAASRPALEAVLKGISVSEFPAISAAEPAHPSPRRTRCLHWTGTTCQVTSVNLTDGVGTLVSPAVGILTLTGTVHGTCGGQDISGQKIHANTVYRKDGDGWKWLFGFNSPT